MRDYQQTRLTPPELKTAKQRVKKEQEKQQAAEAEVERLRSMVKQLQREKWQEK
jgi:hypothetical protein